MSSQIVLFNIDSFFLKINLIVCQKNGWTIFNFEYLLGDLIYHVSLNYGY